MSCTRVNTHKYVYMTIYTIHNARTCSHVPCVQQTPMLTRHSMHTHTGAAPRTPHTHLYTDIHTPTHECAHTHMHVLHTNIHSAHMYSCILCTSHIYHTTRYMWAYPPQVRTLPTRRTTRINHAPPTPALNPRKARGPSGLKGAPPLTRRAPWVQRGLGPTAGGRPGLSTPSSRSPGQQGRDRAAVDAGLLDPGTPTWCMSAPAPCTLQRDPVKPLIFYPVHGIHFHMFPFLFS